MNTMKVNVRDLDMKARDIRLSGSIPGVLYGAHIDSIPVQVEKHYLHKKIHEHGEIFKVKTAKGMVSVKFEDVQLDPVSHEIVHFSLLELPKGEECHMEIPLEFIGESRGVKEGGVFLALKDKIEVSGIPSKMPDSFTVDITTLEIGDKIEATDIKLGKYLHLMHSDDVVAVCTPPKKQESTEDTTSEELSTSVA